MKRWVKNGFSFTTTCPQLNPRGLFPLIRNVLKHCCFALMIRMRSRCNVNNKLEATHIIKYYKISPYSMISELSAVQNMCIKTSTNHSF